MYKPNALPIVCVLPLVLIFGIQDITSAQSSCEPCWFTGPTCDDLIQEDLMYGLVPRTCEELESIPFFGCDCAGCYSCEPSFGSQPSCETSAQNIEQIPCDVAFSNFNTLLQDALFSYTSGSDSVYSYVYDFLSMYNSVDACVWDVKFESILYNCACESQYNFILGEERHPYVVQNALEVVYAILGPSDYSYADVLNYISMYISYGYVIVDTCACETLAHQLRIMYDGYDIDGSTCAYVSFNVPGQLVTEQPETDAQNSCGIAEEAYYAPIIAEMLTADSEMKHGVETILKGGYFSNQAVLIYNTFGACKFDALFESIMECPNFETTDTVNHYGELNDEPLNSLESLCTILPGWVSQKVLVSQNVALNLDDKKLIDECLDGLNDMQQGGISYCGSCAQMNVNQSQDGKVDVLDVLELIEYILSL